MTFSQPRASALPRHADATRRRPTRRSRIVPVTLLFALAYVAVHSVVLGVGAAVAPTIAIASTSVNAALWFALTPLTLEGARRRLRRRWARTTATFIVVVVTAAAYGVVQSTVAAALGMRQPVPAIAGVFYYLDVNLAAACLAALVRSIIDQNRSLVARDEWLLVLDAKLSEARSRFLALQLQPHFLFNSLNMVLALASDAPREASRVLRHLRTLLLATARRTTMPWITLREEFEVLDAYLDILIARHADVLRVERVIDAGTLDACLPPLILQPLVENAIRHSLLASDGVATVRIAIAFTQSGHVCIHLSNPSAPSENTTPGFGIGLRNTRERLARFFRDDYTLSLDSSANVAVVTVVFPFRDSVSMRRATPSVAGIAALADSEDATPTHPLISPTPIVAGLGIAVFWLSAWLFWAYQMYFYRVARGHALPTAIEGSWADFASAVIWLTLTPLVLATGQLLPIRGRGWIGRAAGHVALSIGVSLVQVRLIIATGQLGSRPLLSAANFNQIALNCLIYFMLLSLTHRRAAFRWFQERETAERRLEAELAEARWRALAMESQPALIAAALDRIADRMDRSPEPAEEDVLELADVLRLLLQASESATVDVTGAVEALDAVLALHRSAHGTDGALTTSELALAQHIRVSPSELIAQSHELLSAPRTHNLHLAAGTDSHRRSRLRISAPPDGGQFDLSDRSEDAA